MSAPPPPSSASPGDGVGGGAPAVLATSLPPGCDLVRDPLTQAYARAGFDACLNGAVRRARRRGNPCVLCVIDLDHFKSINDAYGHGRGDQILRGFAAHIQSLLRPSDCFFRLGGDEFVLLLPDTDRDGALSVCQRIQDSLANTLFPGETPLKVSVSLGVAEFPSDARDGEELLVVADRRSYDAKRQGRACFVAADATSRTELYFDPKPRLIERERALSDAAQFLDSLASNQRGVFDIRGPRGSGRSAVLAQVAKSAEMRGFIILSVCGRWSLQRRPFAAVQQTRWPHHFSLGLGAERFAAGLESWMREHRHDRLLIAVDDLEYVDAASRSVLRTVFERLTSTCLAMVEVSVEDDSSPASAGKWLDAKTTTRLEPLSEAGIELWLRTLLRSEPAPDFGAWLGERTQGLPARIRAQLELLASERLLSADPSGTALSVEADYRAHPLPPQAERRFESSHNLPAQLTDFIGREHEQWQLDELLEAKRLVTLVGPGGVGKTRLALETADARQGNYPNGVWFVPLEATRTVELVVSQLTHCFGLKESSGQSALITLKAYLREQELLLVLDNFEQVLDAAPLVTELLASAPQLQVLVTSRERLNVLGEQVFLVPPLSTPNLERLPELSAMNRFSSVNLFINRAQASLQEFALREDNLRAVAEVSVRLDGLPLAIELAAARLAEFTPEELAQQLDQRLQMLATGPRNLNARQRTLRGAIDWSYELLPAAEQQGFAYLAAFAGDFSRDGAWAVCRRTLTPPAAGEDSDLDALLTSLTGKSLLNIYADDNGEPRFSMLQTLREYALERLTESSDALSVRRAHAAYLLGVAEAAAQKLLTSEQRGAIEQLSREQGNLREALGFALEHGMTELSLRLVVACWRFWQLQGYHGEGRAWLERAFALTRSTFEVDPAAATRGGSPVTLGELMAQALCGAGWLAHDHTDYDSARALFQESLRVASACGSPRARGMALQGLGMLSMLEGENPRARACFEEAQAIFREVCDAEEFAWASDNLGQVLRRTGELAAAETCHAQSLAAFSEIGHESGIALTIPMLADTRLDRANPQAARDLLEPHIARLRERGDAKSAFFTWALALLGEATVTLGDFEAGERVLSECVALCKERSFTNQIAYCEEYLGRLWTERRDFERAKRHFRTSLQLQRNLSDPWALIRRIERAAVLFAECQREQVAAALLGTASTVRESLKMPRVPACSLPFERVMRLLRERLSPEELRRAWEEGEKRSLSETLELALAQLE